jgi:hypothetical protein
MNVATLAEDAPDTTPARFPAWATRMVMIDRDKSSSLCKDLTAHLNSTTSTLIKNHSVNVLNRKTITNTLLSTGVSLTPRSGHDLIAIFVLEAPGTTIFCSIPRHD